MAAQEPSLRRAARHSASQPTPPRFRLTRLMGIVIVLGLMGASFFAGWFSALGPVAQALGQLHRDIQAVQAHRPLVVRPLNFWSALGGFVLGMLVMSAGNHWIRSKSTSDTIASTPIGETFLGESEDSKENGD